MSSLEKLPKKSRVDILLIGSEIPEWFLHCKEGSISFMVPQYLYNKFLGLALCFVLGLEEGKVVDASCQVQIFVNGKNLLLYGRIFYSVESDHVWLIYFPRRNLKNVEEHLRNDWSHFEVCLRVSEVSLKKHGFRLVCVEQEDHLRVCAPTLQANLEFQGDLEVDNS